MLLSPWAAAFSFPKVSHHRVEEKRSSQTLPLTSQRGTVSTLIHCGRRPGPVTAVAPVVIALILPAPRRKQKPARSHYLLTAKRPPDNRVHWGDESEWSEIQEGVGKDERKRNREQTRAQRRQEGRQDNLIALYNALCGRSGSCCSSRFQKEAFLLFLCVKFWT